MTYNVIKKIGFRAAMSAIINPQCLFTSVPSIDIYTVF